MCGGARKGMPGVVVWLHEDYWQDSFGVCVEWPCWAPALAEIPLRIRVRVRARVRRESKRRAPCVVL